MVEKLNKYDLSWVFKYMPNIVILCPEVVGFKIDDLAKFFALNIKFALLGCVKL